MTESTPPKMGGVFFIYKLINNKKIMSELKPLVCDTCGRIIYDLEEGFIEWLCDEADNLKAYGFRIAHATKYSPLKARLRHGCYKYGDQVKSDISLVTLMENRGLLLNFINREKQGTPGFSSPHVKDLKEFNKLMERLEFLLNL